MIVKMIQNLENKMELQINRLETRIEKMQEMFNKDLMAPHSSTLAWKIPWTEKPGRLQFMGSLVLDMTEQLHFHALVMEMATHSSVLAWRIPGMGSLVGCHLWGCTESDTTEVMQQQQQHCIIHY